MKHFKAIILFLVILFLGQWVIVTSFDWINLKSSFRFSKVYSKSTKMNNTILCIGDSRGVNSFYSPYVNEKYSVSSFNVSYNGLRMPIIQVILEDYLNNHQFPETVFIEISTVFNNYPEINYSAFNLYSNKSDKLAESIKAGNYKTYLISSIFPLYRFNNELFYRSLNYLNKSDQDWINRYNITEDLETKTLNMESFDLELNEVDLHMLKKTVKQLKDNGIKVILFVAPYHPYYLSKMKNLKSSIDIVEKATDTNIYDISSLLTKSEYFADRIHTNENGASFIADTLMKLTTYSNMHSE